MPPQISEALERCSNSEDSELIVFISKIINVPKANYNEHGLKNLEH